MSETVTLTIDDAAITVPLGTTLHKAALAAGISIPTLCYHDYCTANGLCRLCVVEVEGARVLAASCVTPAADGMQVQTNSTRVRRARRTILEMLVSSVDLSESPELLQMLKDYEADTERYPEAERREPPVIDDNPMYIRDYAKCVLCWRCVQVCAEDAQYTFALTFSGRGYESQIATFFDRPIPESTCVFCGQCVGVCPTGALKPKREWLFEQGYTPDEVMNLTRTERRTRKRK
jgi:NADH dehydrogenase/NADH:ubiquinone oxidoreductase subunit G